MPNLFKLFKSKKINKEFDFEFELANSENNSFEMPSRLSFKARRIFIGKE